MQKDDALIAIYSRKSKFTGKGESIGNQVELCKTYIYNVFGEIYAERCAVFEDEGFSGGNLRRPAFQRMMEDVRKKKYRAIVVYRLDRISRNISDFTGLIDELTKLNVSFVSIREQFDTGTPMGRAMMFIISVFSQLERETIAERIRDNMHELAKTGRWLGGNVPIGFQSEAVSNVTVDGKNRKSFKLVPVPEEAEIPKLIFDLYTQTDSLTAVEAELLRRQVKTRQGKDFTRFAIKAILQNPVYMTADAEAYDYFAEKGADLCVPRESFNGNYGIMAYNRTEQGRGKTNVLLHESKWIIALGKHPGLVSSEQWLKVQESLTRNKSKAYRKARRNEALLTGVLYCSCGERMYPKLSSRKTADGKTNFSYVCKMKERSKRECCRQQNINGNLLDAAVMEQIKRLNSEKFRLLLRLKKGGTLFAESREYSEKQLEKLHTKHTENTKIIKGLVDSLGIAGESDTRRHILDRIEELTQLNRDIAQQTWELEQLSEASCLSDLEFDTLRQKLSVFHANVDDMAVEEKRAAVRAIVQKVVWDGTNAHVVLCGAENDLNI